ATKKHASSVVIIDLLSAFAFFFVLLAALLPLYLSSYSLVGEKTEKSLEPLLATPMSDSEILVGKYLASLIPVIIALYIGMTLFIVLSDLLTYKFIGYYFYPNQTSDVLMFLDAPLAMLYGIGFGTLASARASGVQTSYQLGGASLIPFLILYVLGEAQIVDLANISNILYIGAALFIAFILVFYVGKKSFNREKILTSWR
ncbi:ABC-2 type transporter, partial [mine drainage metagenome]